MKTLRILSLLCLTFLFKINSFAQVSITSLSVVTSTPNNCDSTTIRITGQENCANYSYNGFTVTQSGNAVTVFVNFTVGAICQPAIVSYNRTLNIGVLPSGNVSLTVTTTLNGSNSATSSTTVSVVSCCTLNPNFTANSSGSVCTGDTLQFADSSANTVYRWRWYVNNQLADTSQNLTVLTPNAGAYTVKLEVADTCGTDSITRVYHALGNPDLGPDTSVCTNQAYRIAIDTNWASASWSTGSSSYAISLTNPDTIFVNAQAGNGCTRSDTMILGHVGHPLDLGPDQNFCPNDTITLDIGNAYASAVWSTGASGKVSKVWYWASVICNAVDTFGCRFNDVVQISPSNASMTLSGTDSICSGDSASFSVTGLNLVSILWSTGDTGSAVSLSTGGTYSVSSINTDSCALTEIFDLVEIDYPLVSINDTAFCDDQSFHYVLNSSNSTYLWNTGSDSSAILVDTGGTYYVEVTRFGMCSSSDTAVVTEYAYPTVDVGADDSLCTGDSLLIIANGVGDSFEWQDGSQDTSFLAIQAGTYWVTLTNGGICSASDTIVIHEKNCETPGSIGEIEGYQIKLYPNPASDYIHVLSQNFMDKIRILDLGGRLIEEFSIEYSQFYKIATSAYSSGIYLLEVTGDRGAERIPIIIK